MKITVAILALLCACLCGLGCQETETAARSDGARSGGRPAVASDSPASFESDPPPAEPTGSGNTTSAADSPGVTAAIDPAGSDSTESGPAPTSAEDDFAIETGLRGAFQCSNANCHGSTRPKQRRDRFHLHNEFRVWQRAKLHSEAWTTLTKKPAQRIARNLARGGPVISPAEDPRCLSCHTIPLPDYSKILNHNRGILEEGVSCESCHGPAEGWFNDHKNVRRWRQKGPEDRAATGLVATKSLPDRARMCVKCHVGAPPSEKAIVRDANHEIMAAGHPRLDFEFWSFHEGMPWPKEKPVRRDLARTWVGMPNHWDDPDDAAALWLVGQVATAEASLKLLKHRAESSDSGAPWPEFAEYDCLACHHDLKTTAWRRELGYAGRTPGSLPWGNWTVLSRVLAADPQLVKELETITQEMQKPWPDRARVRKTVDSALPRLEEWIDSLGEQVKNPQQIEQWLRTLAIEQKELMLRSWDTAHQLTLALTALWSALPAGHPQKPQLGSELLLLNQELSVKSRPAGFASPAVFDPQKGKAILDKIGRLLQ